MDLKGLDGNVVFITGGAHGIGRAAASAFAGEGASVFLVDVDEQLLAEALTEIRAETPGTIAGTVGDVRSRWDVERAVGQCEHGLGPIDVCVNNAGIFESTHTLVLSESEWDRIIDTNLTGMFRVAQVVARGMARRGSGVILNTSSSGGIAGEPGHAHYEASKAGILGLTRAMASELCQFGIRVNALCPGQIATYAWENVELQRLYESRIPARRSAAPREVAAVHLFLASAEAQHVNGASFIVDGGMLAGE